MNSSAFREKESGKEIKHKLLEIDYEEMQQPIPAEMRANIGKKSQTE